MSERIDKIARILKMFLEEIKDIRKRIANIEKRLDALKARVDTLESSSGIVEEPSSVIKRLFDIDMETESEREARQSLIELVTLYDRFLEMKKLGEEIFEETEA